MKQFSVKYLRTKDSFCYFSEKNAITLTHGATIQCKSDYSTIYLSIGIPNNLLKDNEIGIGATYAQLLNLKENESISVNPVQNIYPVKHCCILPESRNDYEMVESLADIIQEILLQQLMVVSNGQRCIIWLTNSMYITATIENIQPASPGMLVNLTEIELLPPKDKTQDNKNASSFNMRGFLDYFSRNSENNTKQNCLSQYQLVNNSSYLFRLHDIIDLVNIPSLVEFTQYPNDPFTIFIDAKLLSESVCDLKLFRMSIINITSEVTDVESDNNINPIIIRAIPIPDLMKITNLQSDFDLAFTSSAILNHLKVPIGSKCLLEEVTLSDPIINVLQIHASKVNVPIAIEYFKLFLIEHCERYDRFVLLPNIDFEIRKGFVCTLKFIPDVSYCVVHADFIRQCKFVAKEIVFNNRVVSYNLDSDKNFCDGVMGLRKVVSDLKLVYNVGQKEKCWPLENYLIIGKEGTGKTLLAEAITNALKSSLRHPYSEIISCKEIKGKTPDSLQKILISTFLRLTYYQPSILILDDLHILCQNITEMDGMTPQALQSNKSSELLIDLLEKYQGSNLISIFATTLHSSSLNKLIVNTRGRCFFKNIIPISDLHKMDREAILNFFMENEMPLNSDLDLADLSIKTEGYSVQDLHDFVKKIVFEANKHESDNLKMDHCLAAFEKSTSLSIRSVQLHSSGDKDFSDIGGLDDIKQIILESVYWPIKQPHIFDNSPLRLQTGILLYGPPGTGKTILAGSVSKQCGLRLIAVNGPELLSKYIGASEQSVRDVFQRAQRAKPCILFFDEFDSLVPRRGHDSTGVTDRVVNQFLTQLDGVEELSGVYIIAATSRPDLLDPALLRPGRLDRQLYCPLPDQNSRISILKTLSKNLSLSDCVDFEVISKDMDGYSGADIQAVLYSAQMASIGADLLDNNAVFEVKKISQTHLLESLKITRPSLSSSEKNRYQRIYNQFRGLDQDVAKIISKNQKATLA